MGRERIASMFSKEFSVERRYKNVVFCVYKAASEGGHQVNGSLEYLQEKLNCENREEAEVRKAFVFFDGITCAMDFDQVDQKKIYYTDYEESRERIDHLWFMSLALLEKKAEQDRKQGFPSENYLVLVTNTVFQRAEEQKILAARRFDHFSYTPVLVKDSQAGGGALEAYIAEKGKVLLDTELVPGGFRTENTRR